MKNVMLALCVCALMGGCATSRTWERPGEQVLQRKIETGDHVTIVTPDHKTYAFEVTQVGADALHGRRGSKRYKVMFTMIESIHVQRTHAAPQVVIGTLLLGAVLNLALCNDQDFGGCLGGN